MRLHFYAFALCLSLFPITAPAGSNVDNRKSTTKHLAKELSRLGIHRLYVPDFCGDSNLPKDRGAFFAAIFSVSLSHKVKSVAIVSRADAHRFLQQNRWTDCDLERPEILERLASQFGVDALLRVKLVSTRESDSFGFFVANLAGKELFHLEYSEPHYASTEAMFPAVASPSGWPFYFSGLDGFTEPKRVSGQNPPFPSDLGRPGMTGTVIVSGVVTTDGKLDQPYIVQTVDPVLDKSCIETLKTWTFSPAHAPDGTPMPVRVPFAINFAVHH